MPLAPKAGFVCGCGSDRFEIRTRVRFHDLERLLVDEVERVAICLECGAEHPITKRLEIQLTEDV